MGEPCPEVSKNIEHLYVSLLSLEIDLSLSWKYLYYVHCPVSYARVRFNLLRKGNSIIYKISFVIADKLLINIEFSRFDNVFKSRTGNFIEKIN